MGRRGVFTTYLFQLKSSQFTLKSWNEGLSVLYGQNLKFDSILHAKIWLYQHRDDYIYCADE